MEIGSAQMKIDSFVSKWFKPLFAYCDNNQKRAVFYLWLHFLLALRSLHHLATAKEIAGGYILARSCLEFDVSISAILTDASLADRYVDYGAHARNRYLEAQKETMDPLDYQALQQHMISRFGPDFSTKRSAKWYPGSFQALCKAAKRNDEYREYVAYCQITHGTIMGMDVLNTCGLMGDYISGDTTTKLLVIYTLSYLRTTERLLKLLFGKLWTREKEECNQQFNALATDIVVGGS